MPLPLPTPSFHWTNYVNFYSNAEPIMSTGKLIEAKQRLIDSPSMDDSFNAYDGTGERIKRLNHRFRSAIGMTHHQYKKAQTNEGKKQIAKAFYNNVLGTGGNFYDQDGTIKTEKTAIKKIMKSLKDMRDDY
jgi:hypothetical protein